MYILVTDYTRIDYNNERGKTNRGCHKPALKSFYSFYFSVRIGM